LLCFSEVEEAEKIEEEMCEEERWRSLYNVRFNNNVVAS
jgi:hypothetical protein